MTDLLLAAADPLDHVVQHRILSFDLGLSWPFSAFTIFSNHVIMQLVAAALVAWLLPKAAGMRRGDDSIGRLVPRGFGNAIEGICVILRDHVARPALGKYTDYFVPYIWSAFFFVLTCNLLGMIPLADWSKPILPDSGPWAHSIGGTSTANILVTGALALCTLFMIVYNGLRINGMDYVKHFFMGPAYLAWFIAILELIGLLAKWFALAVRLFANMVAGHILLAVLLGFIKSATYALGGGGGLAVGFIVILGSIAINFLELFVAVLQAFIFTFLSAMFIGQAVVIHHDHEHEAHGAEDTEIIETRAAAEPAPSVS